MGWVVFEERLPCAVGSGQCLSTVHGAAALLDASLLHIPGPGPVDFTCPTTCCSNEVARRVQSVSKSSRLWQTGGGARGRSDARRSRPLAEHATLSTMLQYTTVWVGGAGDSPTYVRQAERTAGGLQDVKTGGDVGKDAPLALRLVSWIATADHARSPTSCDSDRVRHGDPGVSHSESSYDGRW